MRELGRHAIDTPRIERPPNDGRLKYRGIAHTRPAGALRRHQFYRDVKYNSSTPIFTPTSAAVIQRLYLHAFRTAEQFACRRLSCGKTGRPPSSTPGSMTRRRGQRHRGVKIESATARRPPRERRRPRRHFALCSRAISPRQIAAIYLPPSWVSRRRRSASRVSLECRGRASKAVI